MATTLTAARLEQFKREAKKLAGVASLSHSEALDRLAVENGFKNWSLLARHVNRTSPATLAARTPAATLPASSGLGSPARYYLHGDAVKGEPAQFYCAQCDLFVESNHFFSKHPRKETLERCLDALARWQLRPTSETATRRPSDSFNVLEQASRELAAEHEAARSPFHHWLERRKDRDTVVGDIARDALRDKTFPVDANSLEPLLSHLRRKSASEVAIRAMREAWKQFRAGQRHAAKREEAPEGV